MCDTKTLAHMTREEEQQQNCCSHNHDCDESSCATSSLHGFVDLSKLSSQNVQVEADCRNVFREWNSRLDTDPVGIQSDENECELILRVPFTEDVKLTGVVIVGGKNGTHPAEVKLFANDKNKIDLENAHRKKPTQKFDWQEDFLGVLEYETDRTKFSSVSSVTIFVSKNMASLRGEEMRTEISYVGLRGEASGNRRDMIVTAVYETKPMAEDHKVEEGEMPRMAM